MKFYGGVQGSKRNEWFGCDLSLVVILIMIWPEWKFVLSECLEYDDCQWIFDDERVFSDGYLNEYGDIIYLFITSTKEVCTRWVFLFVEYFFLEYFNQGQCGLCILDKRISTN